MAVLLDGERCAEYSAGPEAPTLFLVKGCDQVACYRTDGVCLTGPVPEGYPSFERVDD